MSILQFSETSCRDTVAFAPSFLLSLVSPTLRFGCRATDFENVPRTSRSVSPVPFYLSEHLLPRLKSFQCVTSVTSDDSSEILKCPRALPHPVLDLALLEGRAIACNLEHPLFVWVKAPELSVWHMFELLQKPAGGTEANRRAES